MAVTVEDIDLTPPENTLDRQTIRYLVENFIRVKELLAAGGGGGGGLTFEQIMDQFATFIQNSDTVGFTYNDGLNTLVLDAIVQMSLDSDASGLKLVNDVTNPGNDKVYGTNGSGVKGWQTPSGGGGGLSQAQVLARTLGA
jgi:hypothetical protein